MKQPKEFCPVHPKNQIQFFCTSGDCKHHRLGCEDCLLFYDSSNNQNTNKKSKINK